MAEGGESDDMLVSLHQSMEPYAELVEAVLRRDVADDVCKPIMVLKI
jgi:hypothetical protein